MNLMNCRYGLSQGKNLQKLLKQNLCSPCFEDLKIPFVAVATDLYTGELVPIGCGDLPKAVQASCSLPFIFSPTEFNGRILVDGGVFAPFLSEWLEI